MQFGVEGGKQNANKMKISDYGMRHNGMFLNLRLMSILLSRSEFQASNNDPNKLSEASDTSVLTLSEHQCPMFTAYYCFVVIVEYYCS